MISEDEVSENRPMVCLVDDDLAVLESISFFLNQAGMSTLSYNDPFEFLASPPNEDIGCVLIDLAMPQISGIELLRRLKSSGFTKPVIILTGCGTVRTAVEAMKLDANDYLEKPLKHSELLDAVHRAIHSNSEGLELDRQQQEFVKRMGTLTNREREIVNLIADGLASKQIAKQFGISIKTVEVHRSRLYKKLGARSMADLVRSLTIFRLDDSKQ